MEASKKRKRAQTPRQKTRRTKGIWKREEKVGGPPRSRSLGNGSGRYATAAISRLLLIWYSFLALCSRHWGIWFFFLFLCHTFKINALFLLFGRFRLASANQESAWNDPLHGAQLEAGRCFKSSPASCSVAAFALVSFLAADAEADVSTAARRRERAHAGQHPRGGLSLSLAGISSPFVRYRKVT